MKEQDKEKQGIKEPKMMEPMIEENRNRVQEIED